MPVSCLPDTCVVLIREDTKVDILSGEFELIHKNAWVALVNRDLLVSMYSNKGEADLLNINIMDCWMHENIIRIQVNRLDGWVVESTVGVNWEIVILVPSVSNN